MSGAEVALKLLELVALAAPGLLKTITGAYSDEQAIARARDAVGAIPERPAGSAIDAYERGER